MSDLFPSCQWCASEDVRYDMTCPGCRLRQVARCPSKIAAQAVRAVREKDGPSAALAFRERVKVEHDRLAAKGQL